jgi:hypothetical protein
VTASGSAVSARDAAGLTIEAAARRARVTPAYLRQIERRGGVPTRRRLPGCTVPPSTPSSSEGEQRERKNAQTYVVFVRPAAHRPDPTAKRTGRPLVSGRPVLPTTRRARCHSDRHGDSDAPTLAARRSTVASAAAAAARTTLLRGAAVSPMRARRTAAAAARSPSASRTRPVAAPPLLTRTLRAAARRRRDLRSSFPSTPSSWCAPTRWRCASAPGASARRRGRAPGEAPGRRRTASTSRRSSGHQEPAHRRARPSASATFTPALVHPREVFKPCHPRQRREHHPGPQPPQRRRGALARGHRRDAPARRGRGNYWASRCSTTSSSGSGEATARSGESGCL